MKIFILILSLFLSLNSFSISDSDLKNSFEAMEKSGLFSEEQITAAKKKLESMTPEEREALIQKGKEKLSDPAFQKKAQELLEQYKQRNK